MLPIHQFGSVFDGRDGLWYYIYHYKSGFICHTPKYSQKPTYTDRTIDQPSFLEAVRC